MDRLTKICDRNKCFDLFSRVKIGNNRMYKWRSIKKLVQYRVEMQKAFELRSKMQLLKYLKAFVGFGRTTYMELVLKEIELSKEILILDLELGTEAIIPTQLQQ